MPRWSNPFISLPKTLCVVPKPVHLLVVSCRAVNARPVTHRHTTTCVPLPCHVYYRVHIMPCPCLTNDEHVNSKKRLCWCHARVIFRGVPVPTICRSRDVMCPAHYGGHVVTPSNHVMPLLPDPYTVCLHASSITCTHP